MKISKLKKDSMFLSKLKRTLISVFLKNENEAFYSFQGGKTLYFNKETFLGWKKDFFNTEMMNYIQERDLAFLFTQNKYLEICKFKNKKFYPKFKMKCSLFNVNSVKVSGSNSTAMVLNDKTIIIINLSSFLIIQKIYCEKFSPNLRSLLITNCTFYGEFNAGILTINGNFFLIDFLKGIVHFKIETETNPYYLGNFLISGTDAVFNNQDKMVIFKSIV